MPSAKWFWCLVFVLAAAVAHSARAQDEFPFDGELILDTAPMRGSKRIPNMDVAANGAIALEMWCNRIDGQFVVAGDTITVLTGQVTRRECPPERLRSDEELLATLTQITNWRRQGDTLTLIGPRTLRFKVPSN